VGEHVRMGRKLDIMSRYNNSDPNGEFRVSLDRTQ